MDEILKCDHSNESYEQYFTEVLFKLCKVVLTLSHSVNYIHEFYYSNESYCCAVFDSFDDFVKRVQVSFFFQHKNATATFNFDRYIYLYLYSLHL